MAIEIVDLPIDCMVIFHSFLQVYQRVIVFKNDNLKTVFKNDIFSSVS